MARSPVELAPTLFKLTRSSLRFDQHIGLSGPDEAPASRSIPRRAIIA